MEMEQKYKELQELLQQREQDLMAATDIGEMLLERNRSLNDKINSLTLKIQEMEEERLCASASDEEENARVSLELEHETELSSRVSRLDTSFQDAVIELNNSMIINDKLRGIIQRLEHTISDMSYQSIETTAFMSWKLATDRSQRRRLKEQLESLERQLDETSMLWKQGSDHSRSEISELQNLNSDLQKNAHDLEVKNQELQRTIEQERAKRIDSSQALKQEHARISTLTDDLHRSKTVMLQQKEDFSKQISILEGQIRKMNEELAEKDSTCQLLRNDLDAAKGRLDVISVEIQRTTDNWKVDEEQMRKEKAMLSSFSDAIEVFLSTIDTQSATILKDMNFILKNSSALSELIRVGISKICVFVSECSDILKDANKTLIFDMEQTFSLRDQLQECIDLKGKVEQKHDYEARSTQIVIQSLNDAVSGYEKSIFSKIYSLLDEQARSKQRMYCWQSNFDEKLCSLCDELEMDTERTLLALKSAQDLSSSRAVQSVRDQVEKNAYKQEINRLKQLATSQEIQIADLSIPLQTLCTKYLLCEADIYDPNFLTIISESSGKAANEEQFVLDTIQTLICQLEDVLKIQDEIKLRAGCQNEKTKSAFTMLQNQLKKVETKAFQFEQITEQITQYLNQKEAECLSLKNEMIEAQTKIDEAANAIKAEKTTSQQALDET
eukprot:768599-Hanusia_phi.AAC.7